MIRTLALSLFFAGAAWANPDAPEADAAEAPETDATTDQAPEADAPEAPEAAADAAEADAEAPEPAPAEAQPPIAQPANAPAAQDAEPPRRTGNVTYNPPPPRVHQLKGHGFEAEVGLGPVSSSRAIAISEVGLLSYGIRGRVTVLRRGDFRLSVGGGWTHLGRHTNVSAGSPSDGSGDLPSRMNTRFNLDTVNVGVRLGYTFHDRITPFADIDGLLAMGGTRIAPGRLSQDAPQTLQERAITGGADLLAGVEAILAPKDFNSPVYPAMYAAIGGRVAGPLGFGDLGQVGISGLLVRVGVGLRF